MKERNFNIDKIPFCKNNKFKYNTIFTIIIAVFLACLVAINILTSVLSDKFTAFSVDMTSSNDYTISDENIKYIKKIDKPITIVVTCTQDYYNTTYSSSISQYFADSSGGKYFNQTVELLKNYNKINKNINVVFIDATTPDFNEYKQRYSKADISVGDIIVDYTYEDNGVEKTKFKVLTLEDLYIIEEVSDYQSYTGSYSGTISGSSVETAVTSALFYVTKIEEDKIAVITGYGSADVSYYLERLEISGYDYVEISDLKAEDIPSDATMLLIASPTLDLSQADVKKIDEFLLGKPGDKDFGYNKSLIYFSSNSQFDTPNLDGLLEEWGIAFEDGTVYETNESRYLSGSNTTINLEDAESDFTAEVNTSLEYWTNNLRPMKPKFQASGKFTTYEIVKSADTCVVKPNKAASSWDPNAQNQSSYSSVVLSRYATEDPNDENSARFSNVIAVASVDFVSQYFIDGGSDANEALMTSLINTCAGRVSETYTIQEKLINLASFTPTQTQYYVMFSICVYIIPALTVILGVILFILRKRR